MSYHGEKVTIVIPLFNAEKTIEKCISSLKEQSYHNLQVILVDDASSDQSVRKALECIGSDDRFLILMQDSNKGASAARNLGIKRGDGDFLFFLDADDWLEHDGIEKLVTLAKKTGSDLICSSHIQDFENESRKKYDGAPSKDYIFTKNDLIIYIKNYLRSPYKFTLLVHCWGKLYNLNIVKDNDVCFNENLSQLEDVNFNYQYLLYCNNIAYKNSFIYHHHISSTSQSLSTMMGTETNAIQKNLLAFSAIEHFIDLHDDEELINSEEEVSHLFITTMIITIIRLCKSMMRTPSINTYKTISAISKSPDISKKIKFHTPGPDESLLIFYALKTKIPILVFISGLIRAYILLMKSHKKT